jgi:hypothetical protein
VRESASATWRALAYGGRRGRRVGPGTASIQPCHTARSCHHLVADDDALRRVHRSVVSKREKRSQRWHCAICRCHAVAQRITSACPWAPLFGLERDGR